MAKKLIVEVYGKNRYDCLRKLFNEYEDRLKESVLTNHESKQCSVSGANWQFSWKVEDVDDKYLL
jgi:hypothetical protein